MLLSLQLLFDSVFGILNSLVGSPAAFLAAVAEPILISDRRTPSGADRERFVKTGDERASDIGLDFSCLADAHAAPVRSVSQPKGVVQVSSKLIGEGHIASEFDT